MEMEIDMETVKLNTWELAAIASALDAKADKMRERDKAPWLALIAKINASYETAVKNIEV